MLIYIPYLMSKFERCIASCILSDISMGSSSTKVVSELLRLTFPPPFALPR